MKKYLEWFYEIYADIYYTYSCKILFGLNEKRTPLCNKVLNVTKIRKQRQVFSIYKSIK